MIALVLNNNSIFRCHQIRLIFERVKIKFANQKGKEKFRKAVRLVIHQLNIVDMIAKKRRQNDSEIKAMEQYLGYRNHIEGAAFAKQDYRKKR